LLGLTGLMAALVLDEMYYLHYELKKKKRQAKEELKNELKQILDRGVRLSIEKWQTKRHLEVENGLKLVRSQLERLIEKEDMQGK